MPEEDGPTTWTPPRGRWFKVWVWVLLGLGVVSVLVALVVVLFG